MIKYTKEYIAKLLDKYMDGTSTLEEEDVLAHYFHSGNVPEEWEDYRQLLTALRRWMKKTFLLIISTAGMYPKSGRTIGNSLAR